VKPLLVIGDSLLDRDVLGRVERLCPDAPVPVLDEQAVCTRPGGAALAAALAAADGREVTLLSALGDDDAGSELAALLADRGVELVDIGLRGATPEKVRLRSAGQSLLRLDRGGQAPEIGELSAAGRAAIGWAEAVLVADYGRGLAAHRAIRAALLACRAEKPIVWDPHPRGAGPVEGVALVTPNEAEAALFAAEGQTPAEAATAAAAGQTPAERGSSLVERWGARHVCVTRGADGALLCGADRVVCAIPAPAVVGGDPCGAGDRFSSAVAGALADGCDVRDSVGEGVRLASAFVGAGGAAGWLAPAGDRNTASAAGGLEPAGKGEQAALALAHRVRARGGTVVATGGCFDLLHAGHVQMLRAARALGDCLIVCLNSDASVKRLKGPARPVVAQADRAAVLEALGCVDAVMLFAADTPVSVLARLRPHVWAKGGDYLAEELPERAALESWGGQVVTLPYVEGHSTTGLLKEVAFRVAG
jgi:rfaE bifunctional protein nucleotidyltransferase chain/domain/rfaE bifunctional protein kinase chain/domain